MIRCGRFRLDRICSLWWVTRLLKDSQTWKLQWQIRYTRRPCITHNIRLGLKSVFQRAFQSKAGFCNPVEWRPREFNSPPDTICHWVLDAGTDISDLPRGAVMEALRKGQPLQIHCDGGFVDTVGAAAFVVHSYDLTGQIVRLGFAGKYLARARSAFQAEVTALANAIEWVSEICCNM